MKNMINTWTRKGVPRIRSTQAPMMNRRTLFPLALMIPQMKPIIVPAIKLNPEKLDNPDLDIRYEIPDRVREVTKEVVGDDGYDYLNDEYNSIVIYLDTRDPDYGVKAVLELLEKETFCDNQILKGAIIGLDKGEGFSVVYPTDFAGECVFE